uniref:Uncharacterized protein n=1 Tax=Ficedula albicollis TaxID=59894 RepID=A0A803VTY5_FICAL
MSKDFQAWLSKKKEELNQARPVSAKLDALQSLIEEQKDFKKTMTDQISSYERIVAEGESILQKTQGDDKAELQSQIAALKNNWDEMNKQVKEREDKLADCLEKALKYKQHVENLQPWIEKCQSNLCELKVGINPVEIEDSIVQVRACVHIPGHIHFAHLSVLGFFSPAFSIFKFKMLPFAIFCSDTLASFTSLNSTLT